MRSGGKRSIPRLLLVRPSLHGGMLGDQEALETLWQRLVIPGCRGLFALGLAQLHVRLDHTPVNILQCPREHTRVRLPDVVPGAYEQVTADAVQRVDFARIDRGLRPEVDVPTFACLYAQAVPRDQLGPQLTIFQLLGIEINAHEAGTVVQIEAVCIALAQLISEL
jgi:hypothetical protein